MDELQDIGAYHPGDKVRVRVDPYRGLRGVIDAVHNGVLRVRLATDGVVDLNPSDITNYSLAARRAWEAMPKRAGRPPAPGPRKKMVSLRLDAELWERLGQAVERGLVRSREQAVNTWVRDQLDALFEATTDESNDSVVHAS